MNMNISTIASRIAILEGELERQIELDIEEKRRKLQYSIEKGKITFASEASALHKKLHQGVVAFLWDLLRARLQLRERLNRFFQKRASGDGEQ